jgi:hypothetical protein
MRILLIFAAVAGIAVAADQVPFVVTFTSAVPGGTLPTCSDPNFPVPVALVGTGHATHLGQFTNTQSHCLNPVTLQFAYGQNTLVAANGDLVFGAYYGQLVMISPTSAAIYGITTTTGGTGRFAGATGGGAATGTVDLVTGQATDLLIKGTISQPNH